MPLAGFTYCPFSPESDDGFSVIHYREVNSELGEWAHIQTLASHYDLMG